MRGAVLARIPEDAGTRIHCGYQFVVAEDELCEGCENPATVVIQGETDSMGFEPMVLCDACNTNSDGEEERRLAALDVEDRRPAPGHVFLVSECTNYDIGPAGDWRRSFTSYRKAVSFYREIERKAEPRCGLYPDNGVCEITVADNERGQEAYAGSMLSES